jgi:aryl-alcohol dehydrogenase-like predicted oxidoreductase
MTELDRGPLGLGPLVLGGNTFGWTSSREESFAVLDAFVEAGGRSIDTADVYSDWAPGNSGGESETIIGEWLASRGRRDDVLIGTKVFSLGGRPGLSPANIRAALDDSLRRLQTDHVDVYYAHRDDEDVAQEEYVSAFSELVADGRVRAVGASNFRASRLVSAVQFARAADLTPFTIAQDHYNLVDRDFATTLAPTLGELGIVELPYAGLAGGFLSGKYRPGQQVDSPRAGSAGRYLDDPRNVELLAALDDIAGSRGVSVAAVALAWLRQQPTVGAPIASARTVEQLPALVESFGLVLSDEELARLG